MNKETFNVMIKVIKVIIYKLHSGLIDRWLLRAFKGENKSAISLGLHPSLLSFLFSSILLAAEIIKQ